MKEILEILNRDAVDYVIVGSYARYLQGETDEYSDKDLDIVVDKDEDAFNHLSNWRLQHNRFYDKKGWYAPYYVVDKLHHIEVFNRPLPEYDIINVDGIEVKVKTIEEIKNHYRNLDIDKIGGHDNFQNKLRAIQEFYK